MGNFMDGKIGPILGSIDGQLSTDGSPDARINEVRPVWCNLERPPAVL